MNQLGNPGHFEIIAREKTKHSGCSPQPISSSTMSFGLFVATVNRQSRQQSQPKLIVRWATHQTESA